MIEIERDKEKRENKEEVGLSWGVSIVTWGDWRWRSGIFTSTWHAR